MSLFILQTVQKFEESAGDALRARISVGKANGYAYLKNYYQELTL